jgi:ATP-binding cassette, subfamily B, bacterial MsbA
MISFLRRLWTFVRPYRARLIMGLVSGILCGLMTGLLLIAIRVVVDLVFPGSTTHTVEEQLAKAPGFLRHLVASIRPLLSPGPSSSSKADALIMILSIPAIMFVRGLFGYLNVYFTSWAAARAIADIRATLFNHLQNLSLSFFSQARTGDLIARITNDTQILYGIVGSSFASMIKDPVIVLTAIAVLLVPREQRILTLISIVVLPVCLIPISIYSRRVRKSARAMQGHISELTSLMHESFTGNRIIKAYNLEAAVMAQFRVTTGKYISHVMRVVRANELPSQFTEFLSGVGIALVLIYVKFFIGETPNIGDFVSFVMAIVMMYAPIKSLTRLHNQLHQAAAASQRVFELLEVTSTVADPPHPVPLDARQADIYFEDVDFDYGEKPVLRGINLTVKAGQLVALVGSSGSGKTTVTNLLLRFYDPRRGTVRIGQTDLRQVAIRDLRRQIALVTQETILFHETIRRNIALGRPDATDAEIEAAARAANAQEFILQKPEGYEAVVGEKGVAVSGGQRQRIAIARAILKNAPILVLDEATNMLDTESERVVQAELEKLMHGRTTICIAHRLSTVQKADLIVVLSEGRIVESGKHAELIQRGGVYQRLYELQFQS